MHSSLLGVIFLAACTQLTTSTPHITPETPPSAAPEKDTSDGPKQLFDDPFIGQLVGTWHLTRAIRGKVTENTASAEWVLNHQFLQLHMKDKADPPEFEAIVLIGYSHAGNQYVAHWCDTWGGKFSADAFGKRVGDSIEFRFHYPEGVFFNTFTWEPAVRGWTFRMESTGADGRRVLFAEDTLRPTRNDG